MYTIDELIKAARVLGASPVLVEAALKSTGRSEFTLDEAKRLVEIFAKLEVKR